MKQARARRTYEQVLDAAAEEFARHGYAEANLQRIADSTGMTKGALYGHFASKRALATVLVQHLDQVTDELLDGAGPEGDPPLSRLRTLALVLAERIQGDMRVRAALRLVTEAAQDEPAAPRLVGGLQQRALELVRKTQRDGHLDPELPPEPVASLAVVILFGAHYVESVSGGDDLPGRVRALWDVLSRTLPPDPAGV